MTKNSVFSLLKPSARKRAAVALVSVGALGLAACSPSEENPSTQEESTEQSTQTQDEAAETSADGLEFEEAYVGAKGEDKEMTAVFGTLVNSTDEDIHIVEATGSLDARYELHEVVDGVMQENPDGLLIPANGELVLEPGDDHIMIMDYSDEIAAGDEIELVLKDENGKEYEFKGIPSRVQQSSHDHYGDEDGHGDHDHGEHDHGGGEH